MPIRAFIVGALLALASAAASASLITVRFAGLIDQIFSSPSDPFGAQIAVGSHFSGTYTFDTGTLNTGAVDYGVYVHANPLTGITLDIEGITGSSLNSATPLHYRVVGSPAAGHYIQDIQTSWMTFGGESAYLAQIWLYDPSATALSSVDLVPTAPVLGDYQEKAFWLGIGPRDPLPGQVKVVYIGHLTDLELQAVPEPATLFLIGAATLAGAMAVRRRRSPAASGQSPRSCAHCVVLVLAALSTAQVSAQSQDSSALPPHVLMRVCSAGGMVPDFATGNCVANERPLPSYRQVNPRNVEPNPFSLPPAQPNDLVMRCGSMGRGVDFVTGRCN